VAERIADGATPWKCAPPIREEANREALWQALADGVLEMIASDHSPCTPALKAMSEGNFATAWGGVAGLQLALPVVWTQARARGHGLSQVARWMAERPAKLAGLAGRKGSIAAGRDADLVVLDAEREIEVTPALIRHRHRVTPYQGERLTGAVCATYLRGEMIWDGARLLGSDRGDLL
jgi:allantoinase